MDKTDQEMLTFARAHLERRVLKEEHYDILSCVFSRWEDLLEGDTVVITVKMRKGRGPGQIEYQVWEYFFSSDQDEDRVAYCQVAHTGEGDADDWRTSRWDLPESLNSKDMAEAVAKASRHAGRARASLG